MCQEMALRARRAQPTGKMTSIARDRNKETGTQMTQNRLKGKTIINR
jgi:hypothetical protein